jgi:hypothetical protein
MNALCRTYDNTVGAERAVEALLAAGVPGDDVRLLMGAEIHDARREPTGGFAGAVGSHDHVGTFAGDGHRREEPRGSFAGDGEPAGEGVFGNADRDVVVTYPDGREHVRVAGHRRLKRLLVDAGLEEHAAESDVRALHDGRVLVLVSSETMPASEAAGLIDAAAA